MRDPIMNNNRTKIERLKTLDCQYGFKQMMQRNVHLRIAFRGVLNRPSQVSVNGVEGIEDNTRHPINIGDPAEAWVGHSEHGEGVGDRRDHDFVV